MTRKTMVAIFLLAISFCLPPQIGAGNGPKWIYHFAEDGQTLEQIVRGYSVLYKVDMKNFCKWNKIEETYVPRQGDIFLIANKPSVLLKQQLKEASLARKETRKPRKSSKSTRVATKQTAVENQEMIDAIMFAGNETGVRHAFLAGMLYVETGLGRNTGSCHYQKAKMGKPEQSLFVGICDELGYDPDQMQVSCPQKGQRGGAIGVAQFLPSTWMKYQKRVAKVVGKDLADPWDPRDAAVAMALKVADDAPGVTKHQQQAEIDAAKMYLSGTTDRKYNGHAKKVLAAAKKFEDQF